MKSVLDEINAFSRIYIRPRKDSEVLRFAEENLVPIITPEVEQFLRVLLLGLRPKNILEIGTAIGYSALFMQNVSEAEITTIEIDEEMVGLAEHFINSQFIIHNSQLDYSTDFTDTSPNGRNMTGSNTPGQALDTVPSSSSAASDGVLNPAVVYKNDSERAQSFFDPRIKIIHGDAGAVLPKLDGEFDFIFLDGSKSHYHEYLDDLIRLLALGGVLVCDNALCRGLVISPEYPEKKHRTTVRCLREFLEGLSNRDELETSILPIGDGISVSVKLS